MSEAIALSSPNGKVSQRARTAAQERLRQELFGEQGLQRPQANQPTEAEALRRQASELRGLAARGMRPRANARAAAKLEARADEIERGSQLPARQATTGEETPQGNVRLFSKARPGEPVRFEPDESLTRRMERFIDEAQAGKVRPTDTYALGPTPDVLVELNAPNIGLEMEGDAALKVLRGKHSDSGITPGQLKELPDRLADPLAVFESRTHPGEMVVLANLADRFGRGVIAAVHLGKRSGRGIVNRIESIHPRDNAEMERWSANGLLRYYNDEALASPTTGPLDLGKVVQAAQGLKGRILTKSAFRKNGFSRPDGVPSRAPQAAARSPAQVSADLRASPLGKPMASLERAGALRIEFHPDADWSGQWDGKTAVLNAARSGSEGWLATAMHELGGHGTMLEMLGKDGFGRPWLVLVPCTHTECRRIRRWPGKSTAVRRFELRSSSWQPFLRWLNPQGEHKTTPEVCTVLVRAATDRGES